MNIKIKHAILAFFSLALLFSTLFVQGLAKNLEEEKNVRFGYPIPFLTQDFSIYKDEFKFFPIYESFEFKINRIKSFSLKNFIFSYASFFLLLELLVFILEEIDFKIRKYFDRRQD